MYDVLGYCTNIEHEVLKILYGEAIIVKGSKRRDFYILEGSNVVDNSSSTSEDFHDKNKLWDLWSMHGDACMLFSENFNEVFRR